MKIIAAPASFKECLSAAEVAASMVAGVRRASPEAICDQCPIGDGGEGSMDAIVNAMGGSFRRAHVLGPLGREVNSRYGLINNGATAVIELAEASGLSLVAPGQRDPARASTYGTGQLIEHASRESCSEIILCIGGSATVDGGTGMAQALGMKFIGADEAPIKEPMCGGLLSRVARIDRTALIRLPPIRVACDVVNPLCGPSGAAAVYGPQKGASPNQVQLLEKGLAHFAQIAGGDPDAPGAGAAGGAGYGLASLLGATLERGIDLVLDSVGFDHRVRDASLVLTGEGRLDAQSLQGKACMGVARRAAKFGVPTIAIVGSTGPGAEQCVKRTSMGHLEEYIDLSQQFGADRSKAEVRELIPMSTERIVLAARG